MVQPLNLWNVPGTLYESNQVRIWDSTPLPIPLVSRLEMHGFSGTKKVLINWYINGDFSDGSNIQCLMWIYKNNVALPQSSLRFNEPDASEHYSETTVTGSLITSVEALDIIDMRGGMVDMITLTDRELFNYSMTITEL